MIMVLRLLRGESNVKWAAASRCLFPLSQHLQACWSSDREGKREHGNKRERNPDNEGKKRTKS